MSSWEVSRPSKLLEYLLAVSGLGRTAIKRMLKHRVTAVNGIPTGRFDTPLVVGDIVSIGAKGYALFPVSDEGARIVYEDADILVAEKPAGLLTIATEKEKRRTLYYVLNEYLKPKHERVFIVHRLDRGASGLLVFAKHGVSKETLQSRWHDYQKEYYAVVEGVPEPSEGMLESYLRENTTGRVFSAEPSEHSKLSVTHYRVLKKARNRSLLWVTLASGRKHQIRVQLADIGHPIAGDRKYGIGSAGGVGRLGLHAARLSFRHPSSGKPLVFESPLPAPLEKLFLYRPRAAVRRAE